MALYFYKIENAKIFFSAQKRPCWTFRSARPFLLYFTSKPLASLKQSSLAKCYQIVIKPTFKALQTRINAGFFDLSPLFKLYCTTYLRVLLPSLSKKRLPFLAIPFTFFYSGISHALWLVCNNICAFLLECFYIKISVMVWVHFQSCRIQILCFLSDIFHILALTLLPTHTFRHRASSWRADPVMDDSVCGYLALAWSSAMAVLYSDSV